MGWTDKESLPTGERGLKLLFPDFFFLSGLVAPHGGAWIETHEAHILYLCF